jgi:hypothetical protein
MVVVGTITEVIEHSAVHEICEASLKGNYQPALAKDLCFSAIEFPKFWWTI